MKIRSITLDNVRRFTEPVTIGPIGDGVTLLCEPNEAGKSTLFDALHALFFLRHGSQAAEVKALRPHSGGKVAVECELDHGGAMWRIRKEWLTGAQARLWRNGTLTYQGEAAEDWLSALVSGEAGGPGGLLWVRQGRVSLKAPDKKRDADQEYEERRDLLTAISGAMEEVTGGERMDLVRDRVETDLARLQTATARPRTGGRWAEAEDAVRTLTAEEAALTQTVAELRSDLEDRRRFQSELADLQDPDAAAGRRADLAAAAQALRRAEDLQRDIAAAATAAQLARQIADTATADALRIATLQREALAGAAARQAAEEQQRTLAERHQLARRAAGEARTALAQARTTLSEAQAALRRIEAGEAAHRATRDRARLTDQIEKAEAADAERIAAQARAKKGPDQATVDRITRLAQSAARLQTLRDAAAPQVAAHYLEGATPVQVAGQPLPDGQRRALPPDGRIDLPGIGSLVVTVTGQTSDQELQTAQAALHTALAAGGWPDLQAVADAQRQRAEAERTADLARQRHDTLAPHGLEALRTELASLPEPDLDTGAAPPDRSTVEAAVTTAQSRLTQAEAADAKAAELAEAAAVAAARAEQNSESARLRHRKARDDLAALPETDETAIATRVARLTADADSADAAHATLRDTAPDIEKLRAQHARLKGIDDTATARIGTITAEIGRLSGRIETRGEAGAEEALADVREKRAAAQATLARVIFERDMLARLLAALDAAQKAARDTYFAPLVQELRPLLADLWDEADLIWSDDTLLPGALVRRGTTEAIDVLSGGTQEQIAFLVRLAFARLLARSGRHAPLILDDALVYSDDDRIEKMFDALHGAAGDLQIIVLSCRQRAFRNLGAPTVSFRPVAGA